MANVAGPEAGPARQGEAQLATDRVRAVRLRHSDLTGAGIRRLRSGRGFRYLGAGDQPVPPEELARIKNLVIPPAWQEVWICPWPNGHIQAVGFDAAGRRQYLYHPRWREKRDKEKHDHVLEFAAALPDARKIITAELAGRGLTRERVLAAAVRLLDLGFFRVGGERYAEDNGTYGLATLQRDHVRFSGRQIVFNYLAKGSFERVQAVGDPQVSQVIRSLKARRSGGDELFAYYRQGQWHLVHSVEINQHLKDLTGLDVSAKDFRTWNATVLAAVGLAVSPVPRSSASSRKRAIARVVKEVSEYLGNTPAVCRASYIDPRVIERYQRGETIVDALDQLGDTGEGSLATQGAIEEAVLELLGASPARPADA